MAPLLLLFLFVVPLFLFLFINTLTNKNNNKTFTKHKRKLPPSPPPAPLLGNIHQLAPYPYRNLRDFAAKYGPVMLIRLGQIPTVVVSSADAARELFRTRDLVFASRPSLKVPRQLFYNSKNISFSPYGEYWRQSRKVCVLHLLSVRRVQSFRPVREAEVAALLDNISSHATSGPVNLTPIFYFFTTSVLCKVAFGHRSPLDEAQCLQLHKAIREATALLGSFNVEDFFPSLKWLNVFSSMDKRIGRVFRKLDDFIDKVVEEHIKSSHGYSGRGCEDGGDLVDVLLSLQEDQSLDVSLSRDDIKALILNMFGAGTTTSFITLEWAISELIRNPKKLKKLQEEVRKAAAEENNSLVVEESINNMPYLKAVIKEVLRLHPPVPLLLPRETTEDTELKGYDVPANTRVIINAWAMGRDPTHWDEPDEFLPERFLDSAVDFKGQDFEYIPFGAGRRICPGIHFAVVIIELALANLVHRFDWEMPDKKLPAEMDMEARPGVACHRNNPLVVVAKEHQF